MRCFRRPQSPFSPTSPLLQEQVRWNLLWNSAFLSFLTPEPVLSLNMCFAVLSLQTPPWLPAWEESRACTSHISTTELKYLKIIHHVWLVLPVRVYPFGDNRLGVVFQQVPYVEVGGSIEHAEDCWSGLGPLQWDHWFTSCTAVPLCNRLLLADYVQPDAAVPTAHLE